MTNPKKILILAAWSFFTIALGWGEVAVSSVTFKGDFLEIDVRNKVGYAEGNIEVRSSSGTLTGSSATYYWEASTGTIYDASGKSEIWKFEGKELEQKSIDIYHLRKVRLTSCNHDPPHFVIVSSKSRIKVGQRANMGNARLQLGDLQSFYLPFYSRSLVPRKLRVKVEPGHTSRDGFTAATTIGYPLTPHTYGQVKWDYLQETGNGIGVKYDYFHENIRGVLDTFLVRDHNPDLRPQERRYSVLWNHFQKITSRLTGNARIDFKSDQTFGNDFSGEGNGVFVEDETRGLLSEAGFTYLFDRASIQADFKRRDSFDNDVSSNSFISELLLPRLALTTTKIRYKYLPFFTQFNVDWANQTQTRTNPAESLKYTRNANGRLLIDRDFRIKKAKMTLTPQGSFQESWDSDISTNSSQDLWQTYYSYGLNYRQRMGRFTDLNFNYNQAFRTKQNNLSRDQGANDRGVEQDKLTGSITRRWLRSNRLTLSSGLDLRAAPRDDADKYRHSSSRLDPLLIDLAVQFTKKIQGRFRETYGFYDFVNDHPVNTPLNTSGEISYGQIAGLWFFSQGFNYSKPAQGEPSRLNLNNRFKFFLSRKWYINFYLSYQGIGDGQLNYSKFKAIDKSIQVVRDLHCWIFRMEFSKRQDRTEASFYIDLKANMAKPKNIFKSASEQGYFPYREYETDVDKIFPYNDQESNHKDDEE